MKLHLFADFKPPPTHSKRIKAVGVLGIVAGTSLVVLLLLGILRRKGYLDGKVSTDKGTIFLSVQQRTSVDFSHMSTIFLCSLSKQPTKEHH